MLALLANAFAAPAPVVAMGDGLVPGPADPVVPGSQPGDPTAATVPGGWIPVLADCLEERAPRRFTVVDRAVPGETIASARTKAASVRELAPAWVVVAVGARELSDPGTDPASLRDGLAALLADLGTKRVKVLLVGLVPPTLADPARQAAADDRTAEANRVIASVASAASAAHVDPWADWPRDPAARAAHTAEGGALSDQGHARVAAVVCDALLR